MRENTREVFYFLIQALNNKVLVDTKSRLSYTDHPANRKPLRLRLKSGRKYRVRIRLQLSFRPRTCLIERTKRSVIDNSPIENPVPSKQRFHHGDRGVIFHLDTHVLVRIVYQAYDSPLGQKRACPVSYSLLREVEKKIHTRLSYQVFHPDAARKPSRAVIRRDIDHQAFRWIVQAIGSLFPVTNVLLLITSNLDRCKWVQEWYLQ